METNKLVLVVDDEPGILSFVRITLKQAGYEVISTTNGEEALKLVQSQKPEIMLLDILMQPMTGFEVLDRLRTFSQIPVIVFTARRDIAETALKRAANGYITKPFLPDELIVRIKAILDGRKNEA